MENKIFLGKYRVSLSEIEISDGAGAPLYEGEEIGSGRKVILESVPTAGLKPAVREQLEAEALAAKELTHINVPALYDFGIEDEQLVYVSEYFDGTSAEEWVNTHGPMPADAVLRIAQQVVSALGAASFHRIVHHALNPSNLMLVPGQTAEGEWPLVKVLHFVGIAPPFSGAAAGLSIAAFDKSTHYASPEQLRTGVVDFRSEIYSLGATMWFLLTGAPPLVAPSGPLSVQQTNRGLAIDKLRGMPKGVRRLLAEMLSGDPDARPKDPLAFYRQLKECLSRVEQRQAMSRRFGIPSGVPAFGAPRRRVPVKALALAAVLLAVATLAALIVPEYLRHSRIRQAEEPIGVPIGVPDASTAPTNADAAGAPAANQVQANTALASSSSQTESAEPSGVVENELPAATDSASAANQIAAAPVQPAAQESSAEAQTQLPAAIPVEDSTNAPATVAAAPVEGRSNVPATEAEPQPAEQPIGAEITSQKIVSTSESTERTKTEPAQTETRKERSKEDADVATVPVAKPVSPEVRRAEPVPPGEGPAEVAAAEQTLNTVPQPEEPSGPAVFEFPTNTAPMSSAGSTMATTSRAKKTERLAKATNRSKKNARRRTRVIQPLPGEPVFDAPPVPRGSVPARFIGMTPDGQMMFALPSREVVIVPPSHR